MAVEVVANPIVGGHGLRKQSVMKTARKGQGKAVIDISLL